MGTTDGLGNSGTNHPRGSIQPQKRGKTTAVQRADVSGKGKRTKMVMMEITDSEHSDAEERNSPLQSDTKDGLEFDLEDQFTFDNEGNNPRISDPPDPGFTTPTQVNWNVDPLTGLRASGRPNKATGGKPDRDERHGNMQYEWNKPNRARSSSLIDSQVAEHLKKSKSKKTTVHLISFYDRHTMNFLSGT